MRDNAAFRKAQEAIGHLSDPTPPWKDILSTARDLVGADAGTLMMFDKSQQLLMLEQVGIEQAAEQEYRQHFYKEDTLAKAAMVRPAGIWLDSTQILSPSAVRKNAFHADYLPRSRIGQVLTFTIHKDEFEQTGLSFQRVTAQADASSSLSRGKIALYLQSFMQGLAGRRNACLIRVEAIESAFASLDEAALLVTERGLIRRMSPLSEKLLRDAKMMSADGGSITHTDPMTARRWLQALAEAHRTCARVFLTIPVTWGEACSLDIAPAHASLRMANENLLFVRASKHSAFKLPDAQELCAHFGVTAAEGRVLLALMAGHSPGELASVFGVAERTVRNQIASLMQKMGCNRQAELVRLASLLQ
jgi:DNA-binding CsgD family transcriptional regulator